MNTTKTYKFRYLYIVFSNIAFSFIICMLVYSNYRAEKSFILQNLGKQLKSIAYHGTKVISYKDHQDVLNEYLSGRKEFKNLDSFMRIKAELNKLQNSFELKSNLYTYIVHPEMSDKIIFITMSGDKDFVGSGIEKHHIYDTAWTSGKVGYSKKIFKDEEGTWLSGYAPIKDKKGQVHAIVQSDFNADTEISTILKISITRLIKYLLVTLGLLNSITFMFLGFFNKPLQDLKKVILNIRDQKFDKKIPESKVEELNILINEINSLSDRLNNEYKENNFLRSLPNDSPSICTKVHVKQCKILYTNKHGTDFQKKNKNILTKKSFLKKILKKRKNRSFYSERLIFGKDHYLATFVFLKGESHLNIYMYEINDQVEIEEKFKMEKERAEDALQTKTKFLANMSHEVRTPMNAIFGLTDLMIQSNNIVEIKDHLNILKSSSSNLITILNDILDFSKIESGMMVIGKRTTNIEQTINDVYKFYHDVHVEKNIEFVLEKNVLEKNIMTDKDRLLQVLNNLLSNAIKFTSQGKIILSINQKRISEKEVRTCIFVSDTGIGVSSNKIKEIFNPFVQEDFSTTKEFGGTGLGLTICHEIMTLLGGTIDFQSKKDKGTKVQIEFNAQVSQESIVKNESSHVVLELKPEQKVRVLLAEDNLINAKIAMKFLEKWNMDVVHCLNGAEAVEAAKNQEFNLCLLDLQMPIMGGEEALGHLKKMPSFASVPIIAFTANAYAARDNSLEKAGFDGYVAKPIDFEEMRTYLLEKLDKQENKDKKAS